FTISRYSLCSVLIIGFACALTVIGILGNYTWRFTMRSSMSDIGFFSSFWSGSRAAALVLGGLLLSNGFSDSGISFRIYQLVGLNLGQRIIQDLGSLYSIR